MRLAAKQRQRRPSKPPRVSISQAEITADLLYPAVAPAEQRDEGRPEVQPLLGEEVFVARRVPLVGAPFEDVLLDQALEPR